MSCTCGCSTGPFKDPLFECLCCVNLQHHFAALQSRGITDCSHLSALPVNDLRQYGITDAAEQKRLSKLVRVLQSLTSSAPQVHQLTKRIPESNTARCREFVNEKSGGGSSRPKQIFAGSSKWEVQPEGTEVSDMKIRRTTETTVSIGSVLPETVLINSYLNANQSTCEKLALPTLSGNYQLEDRTPRRSRRDNQNNSCSEPTTPRNGQCVMSSSVERSPCTRDVIEQRRLQTGSGLGRFLARDERVVSEQPTRLERIMHTDDFNYGVPSGRGGSNGATRSRSVRRSHCIKVCVRKRPRTDREVAVDDVDVVRINNTKRAVEVDEMKLALDLTKFINQHMFIFDEVFDESCDNKQIYTRAVQPLVLNLFQRGSAVIFAFGQTGAGKTYTLLGTKRQPGLYWLAARDLFSMIRENSQCLTSYASYYEIYCNRLYDLLNKRRRLQVREDEKHAVCVHGITEHEVNSVDSLVEIVRYGNRYRQQGSTTANAKSSRSHALLQIQVKTDSCHTVAKLIFVDLAGSERAADAGHLDRKTRNECAEINQSLLALKECIRCVDQSAVHTPYRQSKLTHILRDCFLGISPAVLIANVSPTRSACEHTINTLWYAQRVKNMNREVAIRAMRCCGLNVDGCSRTSTPRSYDSARSPADSSSFGTIRSFVPPVDSNASLRDVNHRTNHYEQRSLNYTATCSDVFSDKNCQPAIDFDDCCSCFADDSEKFDVVTSTGCNRMKRGRQRTKTDDCLPNKRSSSSSLTRRKKEQLMRANRRPWLRDIETLQSESQCSFSTDNGDNTSLSPPLTQGLLTDIRSPRMIVDNLPRIDSHGGGVGWLKNQVVKNGERSTKTSSCQFERHSTSNPAHLDTRKRSKTTGTPSKKNYRPESSSPQRKPFWPVLWRSEICPSSESSVNETRCNKFTRPADDNNDCQVLWSKDGQSPAVIVHPAAPNYTSTDSKFSHYHQAQPKSSCDCSSAGTDLSTRVNSVRNDLCPTFKPRTRRWAVLSHGEPRPTVDARQQIPKNQECASMDSVCCCCLVASNPLCEHSACCPTKMLPDQQSTAAAAVSITCRRVPAEEECGENADLVKTSAMDSVTGPGEQTNSSMDSKLPSINVGNIAAEEEKFQKSNDFALTTPRHSVKDARTFPTQNERVSSAAEKQRRQRQTKRTPWINATDDSPLPVEVCERAKRQGPPDKHEQQDSNAAEDDCRGSDNIGGEFLNQVVSNLSDCSHDDAAAQTKPSIVITPEMFEDLSSRISDLVARRLEQASRQQSVMLIDHCQRPTRAPSAVQSVDVDKMSKSFEDFASQAGPGLTASAVSYQPVAETAAYGGRCPLKNISAASCPVADAAVETSKQTASKATSTCSLQQPTSRQPTSATCTSVDNAVDVSAVDNEPIADQLQSQQQQQQQLTCSNENKVSARISRGTCTEPIPTTSRSAINEKSDETTKKTGNDDIGKSQSEQKPVCVKSVNLVTTNSAHSGSSDFLQRICPSQIVHAVRGSNSLRDVTYDDLADQIGQLSDGRRTCSVEGIDCCLLSASPQHSFRSLNRDQRSTRYTDVKITPFLSDLIADEMAQMKGSSSQINNKCSAGNVRIIATDHHFCNQEQKHDMRVSSECTAVSRVVSKKSGRRSKSQETSTSAAAGDQLPTDTGRSSCLQCSGHNGLMNNVDYCRQSMTQRTFFSADDDREIVGLCDCSSSLEYTLMSEHEEHLATIKKLCQQEINLLNTARVGKIDFEDYVDGVRVLLSKKSKNVQTFVQAVDKFH